MPEYLAPGVYVEEISGGVRPIEGVATSTTGFAGPTERGPTNAQLVTSLTEFQRKYGGFLSPDDSFMPLAVKGFFDNGGRRLYVARAVPPELNPAGQPVAPPASSQDLPAPGGGGVLVSANGPGAWGDRIFVQVGDPTRPRRIADSANPGQTMPDPDQFRLTVLYFDTMPPLPLVDPLDTVNAQNPNRREPALVERYDNLDKDPLRGNFVESIINSQSQLVRVAPIGAAGATYARPQNNAPGAYEKLDGGRGNNVANANAIIGLRETTDPNPNTWTGLAALAGIDEVAILCVPDEVNSNLDAAATSRVRDELLAQCNRLGDRFAILQLPRTYTGTDVPSLTALPDTTRAAVYHPWVRVYNPRERNTVLVPPGGFVAGVYARTDIERGVHKAPANEDVRGIITADLPNNERPLLVHYTKEQQDILNPRSVNVIRDFRSDGRGIRVWGARTLSSDPEWRYVNVRRLFLFVEESIDEGTQWVVFEPNDEPTWAKVRRSITNFLISVWRSGALMGTTQVEAFYVRCDRTTMTQDDIDNGRLICYIGIAPVKPAEFVIFRISQKTVEAAA